MSERSHPDEFLNPYTFVPAYPRDGLPKALRDHRPVGHDRLHDDRWTGSIAVKLTVRTPLLLLDTARAVPAEGKDEEHFTYPVLTRDGRPHLPATAIKGMLRSAYEAITNSRFGVFDAHDRPLGWRRVADDGRWMKPVRVSDDGDRLELCSAVRMRHYNAGRTRYADGSSPQHRDQVWALVRRQAKKAPEVDRIEKISDTGDKRPEWDEGHNARKGYVYSTGHNAVGKKYERVFFPTGRAGSVPLTESLRERWKQLMHDYRGAHTRQDLWGRQDDKGREVPPGKWISDEPGRLAWSPHLWDAGWAELEPGTLCYAEKRGEEVIGLYPVAIPRDISARTPAEMLPDSLHPAPSYDEMSSADRVFGWVAPNGAGVRPAGYRGRLRIGPVHSGTGNKDAITYFAGQGTEDDHQGLPLTILSAPKPSQGRFYLADGPDTPHEPLRDGIPKKSVYTSEKGRGLRGRKVYWHHAGLDGDTDYWSEPGPGEDPTQRPVNGRFREFRRPRESDETNGKPGLTGDQRAFATNCVEQRDGQNRSVRGWVNMGTVFTFRIDVRDLDEIELGAMVWLLSLPGEYFHRLGLGKPLGFGSVQLEIDENDTSLFSGKQWAEYYQSLAAPLPQADPGPILQRFVEAFEDLHANEELRRIRNAFLAACAGTSGLPVHYPRARPADILGDSPMPPHPGGRSYEWFTANEKTEDGRGRSLPAAELPSRKPLRIYRVEE